MAMVVPLFAAALIAAGCGDDAANGNGSPAGEGAAMQTKDPDGAMKGDTATSERVMEDEAMEAGASMTAKGAKVKVVNSQYGRVIADGKGKAFYIFDKENTKASECYGECARVWPPVLTKGAPQAGSGAEQNLLGTTKRKNGKLQVTYAGQPLYYYVDDSPGTILCHDVAEFGGLWLVVRPGGEAAS